MRAAILLLMLLMSFLAGCSTREVRCDAQLTPINAPTAPWSAALRPSEAS